MYPLGIDSRPGATHFLSQTDIPAQILRALVQLCQERGVDLLSSMDAPGDLKATEQIDIRRPHVSAPVLEGYVEMTPPFRRGEVDRSNDYTRIKFRAALRLCIDPAGASVDRGTHNGADTEDTNR